MEIKFRAWNGKKMRYGVNVNDGKPVRKGYQWFNVENDIYDSKIMQFTGLKDKNDKELYFDDYVKLNIPSLSEKVFAVIKDDFGIPCFLLIDSFGECIDFKQYFLEWNSPKNDFEIIGNYYEKI